MGADFESKQTSNIYKYRFVIILLLASTCAFEQVNGLCFMPRVSCCLVFLKLDMLPAFEAKDHKIINNPLEAQIVVEV